MRLNMYAPYKIEGGVVIIEAHKKSLTPKIAKNKIKIKLK